MLYKYLRYKSALQTNRIVKNSMAVWSKIFSISYWLTDVDCNDSNHYNQNATKCSYCFSHAWNAATWNNVMKYIITVNWWKSRKSRVTFLYCLAWTYIDIGNHCFYLLNVLLPFLYCSFVNILVVINWIMKREQNIQFRIFNDNIFISSIS